MTAMTTGATEMAYIMTDMTTNLYETTPGIHQCVQ